MRKDKSESIPGVDALIANAEGTAVCYECRKGIPVAEWRANAKMCKPCYDADGSDSSSWVD